MPVCLRVSVRCVCVYMPVCLRVSVRCVCVYMPVCLRVSVRCVCPLRSSLMAPFLHQVLQTFEDTEGAQGVRGDWVEGS
jgi:hypothetical protein